MCFFSLQVMLACTRPGYLYSIDTSSSNAGIPYADSFTVEVHYCLKKVAENITNIQVFGHVKYKKSVWTVVKSMNNYLLSNTINNYHETSGNSKFILYSLLWTIY